MGVLSELSLPGFEEHLLGCSICQSRLVATDNFVRIFRAATSAGGSIDSLSRDRQGVVVTNCG